MYEDRHRSREEYGGVSIVETLIGIDIGTQGTKAAVFTDDGECLAQSFVPSRLHRPQPGVVEEDPEKQLSSVCGAIRKCMKDAAIDASTVAGIGIDGQMAGVIGIGQDGRNVTPYDSWLDTRCTPYIKKMEWEAGEWIVGQAGCPPSFNHGPKILWWMHERKKDYRDIVSFVQPSGYAVMRLSGLNGSQAFIDKTYLHFSGFADNPKSRWDEGLCREFHFDAAKLPKIVDSTSIVGQLTAASARRCGLKPDVPVVAGCGDTAASFLACGAVGEGIGVDVAGTASVFAMTTASFQPDVKHRMLACGQSAVPGLWHPYAYINGGGMNLEWFCREMANRSCISSKKQIRLEDLDREAGSIEPGLSLPLFIPHLGGRVCPARPDLRGTWTDLTWDHGLVHLYRAVLEGVALEYAIFKRGLLELYKQLKIKEMRVTGGGEQSKLWNQIKADALQISLRRVSRPEGAPLGAAMLAGVGVGVLKSLPGAARHWVALAETTGPQRALASLYTARLARYETVMERLNLERSV